MSASSALVATDVARPPCRVLLVEADERFRTLVLHELAEAGANGRAFAIETAATLAEARDRLAGEQFDAVLLDLHLPDCRGLATLDALAPHAVATPIVVITVADDQGLGVEAIRRGAHDYVVHGRDPPGTLERAILLAILLAISLRDREDEAGRLAAELREAHDRLRASEERFRFVADHVADVVTVGTPEGLIRYVSPSVRAVFGYEPKEVVGTTGFLRMHDYDGAATATIVAEAVRNGRSFDVVGRARRKDGSFADVEARGCFVPDAEGKPILVSTARDVSDRIRGEATRGRLAAVLGSSSDALIGTDAGGRIVDWNGAAERLFGYAPVEIVGRSLLVLVPPEHVEESKAAMARLRTGALVPEFEGRRLRKDGTPIDVAISLAPVVDGRGRTTGFSCIVRDIAEQQRGAEARARLSVLVVAAPDAIVATDLGGTITEWNGAAERLYGFTKEEAVGQPVAMLVPPDHTKDHETIGRRYRAGETFQTTATRVTKTGARVDVGFSVAPIRDARGAVIGAVRIHHDRTARRRAEDAMYESEALNRGILEASLDAIVTIDASGAILHWNAAAETTFGHKASEAIGRPMADLIIPASLRELHRTGMQRYLAHGVGPILGRRVEMKALRADGSEFLAEIYVTPVHHARNAPRFAAHVRDVTERRRAERALADSEARLDAFFRGSPVGLLIIDAEDRLVRVNDAVASAAGRPGEAAGPPTLRDVFPALGDRLTEVVAEVRRMGRPVRSLELSDATEEGRVRHWVASFYPVARAPGRPPEVGAIFEETTALRHAEAEVRRWALAFEHSETGIALHDENGVFLQTMNPAYARMHGYEASDLVGQPVLGLFSPDARPEVQMNLRIADANGHHAFEVRRLRKDGTEFPALVLVTSVRGDDGRLLYRISSVHDLTERKRAEETERLARERLAAVTERTDLERFRLRFFRSLSDQLSRPMVPVTRELRALKSASGARSEIDRARAVRGISENLDRLSRLILDLQDVARLHERRLRIERAPVGLSGLFEQVAHPLKRTFADAGIFLEGEVPADLVVHADRARLRQVLNGLLLYAFVSAPMGTTVRVAARAEGSDGVLEIEREGRPIPEAELRELFEPFRAVPEPAKGVVEMSGLELHLAKGLVEAHGGRIAVENPPSGKGTTIRIRWPLAAR
ncbi:MAG: PAS domain S-box protein [Methanobacteriota archaeon]